MFFNISSPGDLRRRFAKWLWTQRHGPRLNIKTVLSTYGDFHVKDKTAVIFNMGIAIPGKTVFLIETSPLFLYSLQ